MTYHTSLEIIYLFYIVSFESAKKRHIQGPDKIYTNAYILIVRILKLFISNCK